ncbi:hypothetical protein PIB30_062984, partial [Stylosanthes scabra]|nr:hypothetical protein [Stylosanthes scabra]
MVPRSQFSSSSEERYPTLPYLVPRKADIGISATHKWKLSANWKGLFCIRDDPRKGTFKLENLVGAKGKCSKVKPYWLNPGSPK